MWSKINYNGDEYKIPFNENDIVKNVFQKFLVKVQKPMNKVLFLYDGKKIDENEILSEIMTKEDKSEKNVSILVQDISEKVLLITNNPLCPTCAAECTIKSENYKFYLKCKNGHITNNILVQEYKELQEIDSAKIICDVCHANNKGNTPNGEFYSCLRCKINMCPSCKDKHLKNRTKKSKHKRNICIYEEHTYICPYHRKEFISYCTNCKKDLCENCEPRHRGRCSLIKYSEFLGKKKNMFNGFQELKKMVDLYVEQINLIIEKMNNVKNNLYNYLEINNRLLNIIKAKDVKLNYNLYQNVKSINFEKAIGDLNKINEEESTINKFNDIMQKYFLFNYISDLSLTYKINKYDEEIRVLSKEFVKINKKVCKLEIDDKQMELNEKINVNKYKIQGKTEITVIIKNAKDIVNMKNAFCNSAIKSVQDLSKLDMSNVSNIEGLFKNCRYLEKLAEIEMNLKKIKSLSCVFYGCKSLKNLKVKKINAPNIEDMSFMFAEAGSLESIKGLSQIDTSNVKNMNCMFYNCKKLNYIDDISIWKTKNVKNMSEMFNGCKSINSLPDISNWDTTNVKDTHNMFKNCESLHQLPDISKWNPNNLENISGMFYGCKLLQNIPDISKWEVDKVSNISELFKDCFNLIILPDISLWNVSNVTDISYMFCNCISLESLPKIEKWNVSNVIKMDHLFCGLKNIRYLPDISKWNVYKVKDMSGLFKDCINLVYLPDISEWITSCVENFESIFDSCENLISLPDIGKWNMKNANNMNSMFFNCSSLKSLPNLSEWNVSNVDYMNSTFYGCSNLGKLPEIHKWDMRNVRTIDRMFYLCKGLEDDEPDLSKININPKVSKIEWFQKFEYVNNEPASEIGRVWLIQPNNYYYKFNTGVK